MNVISINHKNTPIEMRNKISFSDDEIIDFCNQIIKKDLVTECMILSTCNRTEIYYVSKSEIIVEIQKEIARFKNIDNDILTNYYIIYQNKDAITHIYNVSCGINSMILGEDEILHQVKHALTLAQEIHSTGYEINTIVKGAISCAKKIKTETKLSKTPISVGTLTANEVFNLNVPNKTVLIIGITGKIGNIVMKNILSKDNINIIGTIRNHNSLFECKSKYPNVKFINYHERYNYMDMCDIIISATTSPHYTVTKNRLLPQLKTNKERLFLDLAVPQDIDTSIEEIPNTTLKNIDYFKILSNQNNVAKLGEVEKAKIIIDDEIETILKELAIHDFLPYITGLNQYIEKNGIENLLFKMKSKSDSQTFKNILGCIKELIN